MKILIVENDQRTSQALARRVRRILSDVSVSVVNELRRAFFSYQVEQPDIVLMDIGASSKRGADLCARIARWSHRTAVVLYGESGEEACFALEQGAVDFLVKPMDDERLEAALKRAQIMVAGMSHSSRVAESVMVGGVESFLTSRLHGELKLIPLSDVNALKAEDKYVTALHRCGEDLIDEPLVRLEALYGKDHFVRVHRNGLVARRQIRALRSDGQHQHHVLLRDGETFKVSRRHVGAVRNFLLSRANVG